MLIRSIVTDASVPGAVKLGERELASDVGRVLINVERFSLNRGELRFAQGKPAGSAIGWDIAGVVEHAAAGGGPKVGERVVAFCAAADGWAEKVHVPFTHAAVVPDAVDLEVAAALPVAAGTALAAVDAALASLLGQRVLVTGVTGGVGGYAVQLAKAAGAHVTAQVRRAEQAEYATGLGADAVVVTSDGAALGAHAPFRHVIDGGGGPVLVAALDRLDPDRMLVSDGETAGATVELPLRSLFGKGRAHLRGLNLFGYSERVKPSAWLLRLMRLVERGALRVDIGRRGSWTDIGEHAVGLNQRQFQGKAVLTVD